MKSDYFNNQFSSVEDLRTKAKMRMPNFAFEYLDGGGNEDVNITRNTSKIRKVKLQARYLYKFLNDGRWLNYSLSWIL